MILENNLLTNKYFNEVFDLLGTPLVLNGDGEAIITYPKGFKPKESHSNVGLFMAINQALRIFYLDKPTPCKLLDFCTASRELEPDIVIDNNCRYSPWKKSQSNPLCYMGQIWRHWALKDYSPVYKKSENP